MIGAGRHIAALALAALPAGSALAAEGDAAATIAAWNKDRARLFSRVCMAAAPDFRRLDALAKAEGMEYVRGEWNHYPEAVISLKLRDDSCACFMTMGAPDPAGIMVATVERLREDYPDVWRPDEDTGPGPDYSAYFTRQGVEVRLELTFHKFEDLDFLAGFVIAPGGCPR